MLRVIRSRSGSLRAHVFDLGIAGRLGVAFAAVAVLATAANVIAEHGTQIIQRSSVVSPIVPSTTGVPRANTVEVHSPARQLTVAAPIADVHDNSFLEAIGHYEHAVEQRVKVATTETNERSKVAGLRLQNQADAFLAEIKAVARANTRSHALRVGVASLRKTGDAVIRNADERRAVLAAYWSHFDNADAQVKKALDRNNWRIFGRVISRQSLLSLSRALDDIRRRSTQLGTNAEDPSMLDALAQSQALFTVTLSRNAPGLSRAEGEPWVADLGREFAAVIQSRKELAELDGRNPGGLGALQSGSEDLVDLVRGIAEGVRKSARDALIATEGGGGSGMAGDVIAGVTSSASPSRSIATRDAGLASDRLAPDPVGPQIARNDGMPASHSGSDSVMIAAISGAVLLILFVVSVATVRSVIVPIRQFMATTERLAAGDDGARFARGGIKELDALAVSFNRMAASLADARAVTREYQEQLESRVHERTYQLQHLAQHDPLTGLPNRRRLVAHLNMALQRAAREGLRVAVFFLDLDNFKNINDSMGHVFGDLVLQNVAGRLREAAGASGFAARLGGDEFTVIYENAGNRDAIAEVGAALVQAFQEPLSIEGRQLVISISGGASIYPDHGQVSDALLRAADAALFRAKTSGRARVSLFSPDLLEAASLRFSLEQGLRRALEHGELELWFQPEVSFATLDSKLVEALLRWRLPDGEYIAPNDFLSVAEDSGLISGINDWVLCNAIRYAAEWHHGVWPDARVAINVSARQLLDSGFVTRLRELLAQYRLPARCIEIELTETVLQTEAATVDVLREVRQLGISIALDDFGAGYSSLASLERLPLTRVKLDRSLIDTIDTSARSLAIARAIIGLCEGLGLEVTAEGVERHEQLALLADSPELTLQGYLFARPIAADALPEALTTVRMQLESLLIAGLPGVSTVTAITPDPPVREVGAS